MAICLCRRTNPVQPSHITRPPDQSRPATLTLSIRAIEEQAQDRPAGYLADVLSHGTRRGRLLEMPRQHYFNLARKYRPILFGDVVHALLNPIARILDRRLGTRLETCAGCSTRRLALNAWHLRLRRWLRQT